MTKLLGKERVSGPFARLAPPDAFETIDAGDLDNDHTVLLPFVTRKIRVQNAGDLEVLKRDGTTEVIPALAAKETIVVAVAKILAGSTTVTGGITVFY